MKLKRLFCMFLSVVMLLGVSAGAFAENESAGSEPASAETQPASSEEPADVSESSETAEVPESDPAEWTVMIYLCGTDLESDNSMATTNLVEISETSPNDSVNVVIETGGTNEWHAQDIGLDIATDKTQRYHFGSDGFVLDEELPLQNMASADTLSEFIRTSAERFPAEKYLLVLWDHGGGSCTGLIVDQKYNNSVMTLDQLELGVNNGGVQFEATVLDTCLMASLETAQALQDSCHYLIASEETVPGQGSDYYNWLQYLYDMPECTGKQFGRRVCDSAQQKYAELNQQYDSVTFSVIDLSQLDPVTEAFNTMFAELREAVDDPNVMLAFSMAARRAESYASAEMVDLGDLVNRARGTAIPNKTANAVLSALDDAVVYEIRGVDHSYSTGLSFFYSPSDSPTYLDRYARPGKNAEYLAFIDRVNPRWAAPTWVYDEVEYLSDVSYDNYGVEVEAEVTEDGQFNLNITNAVSAVSSIDLVLYAWQDDADDPTGEGCWTLLGHDPLGVDGDFSTGAFTAAISGKVPTLNGELCEVQVATENTEYTIFKIPVILTDYGNSYNLIVIYRYDTPLDEADPADENAYAGTYEVLGIEKRANSALPGRNVYTVSALTGLMISPVLTQYTQYGDENGTVTGNGVEISSDLNVELIDLPAGRYAAAFSVTNVFGKETVTDMSAFTWDGTTAVFDYEAPEADDLPEALEEPAA